MKRTLRPCVQVALEIIASVLAIFLLSVNDFSIGALPVILLVFALLIADVKILEVFGK